MHTARSDTLGCHLSYISTKYLYTWDFDYSPMFNVRVIITQLPLEVCVADTTTDILMGLVPHSK